MVDEQFEESGRAVCYAAGYCGGGQVGGWDAGGEEWRGDSGTLAGAVSFVCAGDAVCSVACVSFPLPVMLCADRLADDWCRVSIAIISTLVAKTDLLGDDPLLWFTMMLMPTGPSAMKLTALAEATHAEDEEKMAITKFLSVCNLGVLPGRLG